MDASAQRRHDALTRVIDALGLDVPHADAPHARARLENYIDLLARFGSHTDLTGARDEASLVEIAVADALVMLRHRSQLAAPWIEVGAGGASLSVPLACVLDGARGVMFEPRQKRGAFLRLALGHLGLHDRLRVDPSRVDGKHLPSTPAETAFARAVLAPDEWMALARRLIAPTGHVVVLSTAPLGATRGLRIVAAESYNLPFAGAARTLTWLALESVAAS